MYVIHLKEIFLHEFLEIYHIFISLKVNAQYFDRSHILIMFNVTTSTIL